MFVNVKANKHKVGNWLWFFLFCFNLAHSIGDEKSEKYCNKNNNNKNDNNNSHTPLASRHSDRGKNTGKMHICTQLNIPNFFLNLKAECLIVTNFLKREEFLDRQTGGPYCYFYLYSTGQLHFWNVRTHIDRSKYSSSFLRYSNPETFSDPTDSTYYYYYCC